MKSVEQYIVNFRHRNVISLTAINCHTANRSVDRLVYPLTRSPVNLELNTRSAVASYIKRRQRRAAERERGRQRETTAHLHISPSRRDALGLNALGPVHRRLVRCCKPEFELFKLCDIYRCLVGSADLSNKNISDASRAGLSCSLPLPLSASLRFCSLSFAS